MRVRQRSFPKDMNRLPTDAPPERPLYKRNTSSESLNKLATKPSLNVNINPSSGKIKPAFNPYTYPGYRPMHRRAQASALSSESGRGANGTAGEHRAASHVLEPRSGNEVLATGSSRLPGRTETSTVPVTSGLSLLSVMSGVRHML